jgi:hypothetical protein
MAAAAVAEISVVVVEDFQLIAAVVDHLASHPTGVAGEEEEEEDLEEATVEAVDSEVEEEVAAVEDVDDFNKNLFNNNNRIGISRCMFPPPLSISDRNRPT